MFTFTPKTEQDFQTMNLLEPGEGNFEIMNAIQKVSENGNPMIELILKVWDKNGKERNIFDYLVNVPSMEHKIKRFCDCCGLEVQYQAGCFAAEDCIGKSGKLKIAITKDKSGQYPDKNTVAGYLVGKGEIVSFNIPALADDDLPF